MFQDLLARCQAQVSGRRKFCFKTKLGSPDFTVFDLCATLFDRAKFRRTKGAVKLHRLLARDCHLPAWRSSSRGGKRHDVQVARTSRFELGAILVMNRGYVDFRPPNFDSSRSVLRGLIWTHEPSPSNLP